MLNFMRLDTGCILIGVSVYTPMRELFPFMPGNAVRLLTEPWRLKLGMLYAGPVNVLTFPANDDEAHMRASVVIH